MKRIVVATTLLLLSHALYAQELYLTVAPTISAALHYRFVAGGPGQKIKPGLTTSLDYLFTERSAINFGFGLNYHFNQVEFVPNMNTENMPRHTENVSIASLRLKSVLMLGKRSYLSLDPSMDFHLNYRANQTLNIQSGIGLSLGLGRTFQLNETLSLNMEPKVWIHNIVPFIKQDLPYRLTAVGLNVGVIFGTDSMKNRLPKG